MKSVFPVPVLTDFTVKSSKVPELTVESEALVGCWGVGSWVFSEPVDP